MTNASRLLSVLLVCASAQGVMSQTPGQSTDEENIRREEKKIILRDSLNSANLQLKQGDLGAAAKTYEQAWTLVEYLGTSVEAERAETIKGFTSVYMYLAQASLKAGDYKEADVRLKRVLSVDPTHVLAKRLKNENDVRLEELKGRAPSEKALEMVGEKRKEMIAAGTHEQNGVLFFELGKLTEAGVEFREALKINPDSRAAHHYLAAIEEREYARAAASRELASKGKLVEVEEYWDTQLPKLPEANPYATTNSVHTSRGRQLIYNKLDRIRLNELKFEGLPLSEVVKTLEEQSRLRDPDRKGINFIISSSVDIPQPGLGSGVDPVTGLPAPSAPVEPLDVSAINVRLMPGLKDVRLADALDAITKVADRPIKFSIEDYAVIFTQRLPQAEQLFTRRFRVNPNTFYQGLESVIGLPLPIDSQGGGGGGAGGGGGGGGGMGGGMGGEKKSTRKRL
jgi:tetratricopeptide (TPR) repeat protein